MGSNVPDSYLPTDPKELRTELALARKQLSKLELARYTPLHPKETVRNIFLGKRVSFEFYKSFKDKKDLLDEALMFSDGDAILAVSSRKQQKIQQIKCINFFPSSARRRSSFAEL